MDTISEQAIRARLHTAVFGRTLEVWPSLDSTNTRCRALAQTGAPEGTVVTANAQSAGRGRRGRAFFSPAGGVYLSLLLRPPAGMDPGRITCCGAVAAARAIHRVCGAQPQIKWVNDLFLHGRKLCGILAEGEPAADGRLRWCVLGIGINVAAAAFPPPLQPLVTTLENEGFTADRSALIAALLEEWEHLYPAADGAMMAEYRWLSFLPGRTVTVLRGEEAFTAVAEEITDEGHLLVRTPEGERVELHSGEVSIQCTKM